MQKLIALFVALVLMASAAHADCDCGDSCRCNPCLCSVAKPRLKVGEALTVRRLHLGYQIQTRSPFVQIQLERLPANERGLRYEATLNEKTLRVSYPR